MTLREMAEKASTEVMDPRGDGDHAVQEQDIADAIQRVAKEFAERAVRSMFEVTHQAHGKEVVSLTDPRSRTARNRDGVVIGAAYFGAFDLSCDTDRWPLSVEDFFNAAIAEADKG